MQAEIALQGQPQASARPPPLREEAGCAFSSSDSRPGQEKILRQLETDTLLVL